MDLSENMEDHKKEAAEERTPEAFSTGYEKLVKDTGHTINVNGRIEQIDTNTYRVVVDRQIVAVSENGS